MVAKIRNKIVKIIEPSVYEITDEEGKFIVNMKERTCSCGCNGCKHLNFVMEHEADIIWEERVWEANRRFEEWRRNLIAEKMRRFKPVDEETKKVFKALGFEYDESLSATLSILFME